MKSQDLLSRLQSRMALRRNYINSCDPVEMCSNKWRQWYIAFKEDQQLYADLYREIVSLRRGNASREG